MYRDIKNYENVTKMNIQGGGMYGIPAIAPAEYQEAERAETDRQLNNAYANEKEFVKRSRAVRKGLRGTKRGI